MKDVLVISSVFPVDAIDSKRNENDIILKTNILVESENVGNIRFIHAFIFPKSYYILGCLNKKWKQYYTLGKQKIYLSRYDKALVLFPLLMFPLSRFLNTIFFELDFLLNSKKYRNIVLENNIDCIHAHSVSADGYLGYKLSKKFNLPLIITVRELNKSSYKVSSILNRAHKIVCINKIDESLISSTYRDKIEFISHGVDDVFYKKPKSKFFKEGKVKILTVCRLIPLKNIDKVIRTLALVEFDFLYEIYGEGQELENLRNLISELNLSDKIFIRAQISYDQVSDLYTDYDIFVMPSFPEALGRVFIEAMAAGLIVVGAKNTGVDGIVKNAVNGYLVNHNNIEEELLNILKSIVNGESLINISEEAYNTSIEFNWKNIINKISNLYE